MEEWSVNEPNTSTASGPAYANGTLFYASAVLTALGGEGTPRLRALHAETGALKWQVELPKGDVQDRPVVDGGIVYIILSATQTTEVSAPPINGSCHMYGCSSAYNESHACQCNPTCRQYGNCCPDYCTFCPIPPPPSPPPPPPPRTFLALDAETGRLRWSTNASASATAPAVANGLVYVTTADNSVYAYGASNGSEIWHVHGVSNPWSTPVIAQGILYTSEGQGVLHALDAYTGHILWNRTFAGYNAMAPTVSGGTLYIAGAFDTLYVASRGGGV
jgi:outer membrane protein assembly factor BamB